MRIVFFLLPAVLASLPAAAAPPTLDESLSLMSVRNPQISPDGRLVAYERQETDWKENAYPTQLFVVEVSSGRTVQLTRGRRGLAAHRPWSEDRLVPVVEGRPVDRVRRAGARIEIAQGPEGDVRRLRGRRERLRPEPALDGGPLPRRPRRTARRRHSPDLRPAPERDLVRLVAGLDRDRVRRHRQPAPRLRQRVRPVPRPPRASRRGQADREPARPRRRAGVLARRPRAGLRDRARRARPLLRERPHRDRPAGGRREAARPRRRGGERPDRVVRRGPAPARLGTRGDLVLRLAA